MKISFRINCLCLCCFWSNRAANPVVLCELNLRPAEFPSDVVSSVAAGKLTVLRSTVPYISGYIARVLYFTSIKLPASLSRRVKVKRSN